MCSVRDNPTAANVMKRAGSTGIAKGDVIYIDFNRVKEPSVSLDRLHRIVSTVRAQAKRTWRWKAPLIIGFHHSTKNFGWAYTRMKLRGGYRLLTLSTSLLRDYDSKSIQRTLTHELCHHYRDETFPRKTEHDVVFCRELGKIDKIVNANQQSCQHFNESRSKASEDKFYRGVTLKPGSGRIETQRWVRNGKLTKQAVIVWIPRRGKQFAMLFSDNNLSSLLNRAGKASWSKLRVTDYSGYNVEFKGKNLREFALWAVKHWPSHFVKTATLVK